VKWKKKATELPPASKFDTWDEAALINCIESQMQRCGELFRGLSQPELDNEWVLLEMDRHMETALLATRAIRRRVAQVQSL
jgi:hypothetical protein